MDESKIKLMPANYGRDCIGNGKHKNEEGKIIECLCDECDYMICCLIMKGFDDCNNCEDVTCPRKITNLFLQ